MDAKQPSSGRETSDNISTLNTPEQTTTELSIGSDQQESVAVGRIIDKQILLASSASPAALVEIVEGATAKRKLQSSNQSTQAAAKQVARPRKNDVIMGRGRPYQNFSGNQRMLQIIADHKDEYQGKPRDKKRDFVDEVLEVILQGGTRFLRRMGKIDEEWWEEVEQKTAAEKVWHALRTKGRGTKTPDSQNQNESTGSRETTTVVGSPTLNHDQNSEPSYSGLRTLLNAPVSSMANICNAQQSPAPFLSSYNISTPSTKTVAGTPILNHQNSAPSYSGLRTLPSAPVSSTANIYNARQTPVPFLSSYNISTPSRNQDDVHQEAQELSMILSAAQQLTTGQLAGGAILQAQAMTSLQSSLGASLPLHNFANIQNLALAGMIPMTTPFTYTPSLPVPSVYPSNPATSAQDYESIVRQVLEAGQTSTTNRGGQPPRSTSNINPGENSSS